MVSAHSRRALIPAPWLFSTGRSVNVQEATQLSRPGRVSAARRGRPGYDVTSLLSVAVEVFNERGYDGTSMEDLSKRLGIAKSAIYHHVDSKEHLLKLALDRALDALFEVAQPARMTDRPAVERLEELVRSSVRVLQEQLPYVTLLLRVRGNTAVERSALQRRREFDRLIADLVTEAEADGDIRPDVDPTVTARLLFGMVNSIVEWYRPAGRSRGNGKNGVDLPDAISLVAFEGLRVR
jgi:AcrR family transcriptional regulator